MPYLVDGSNLGGRLAGAAGVRDRAAVLRLLLPLARRRRMVVVFDGPEDAALARDYGPLEVRFAGARTADAMILALLRGRARDCSVASDDRELLSAARERGARGISIDELMAALAPPPGARAEAAKPGDERPVDVADWLEWFRRGGG